MLLKFGLACKTKMGGLQWDDVYTVFMTETFNGENAKQEK